MGYGVAVGLGLSLKMTFLPFVLLPFFILKKRKENAQYVVSLLVTFFVFSIPVLVQFRRFFNWMKSLFLHSGTYESGAKTIIDPHLFMHNLQKLIASERIYFYAVLVLLIALLVQVFRKGGSNLLIRMNLGLLVALSGTVFFVSKHYEVRYFIAALLMLPFLLILIQKNIEVFVGNRNFNLVVIFLLVWITGYQFYKVVPYIRLVSHSVEQQVSARMQTRDVVRSLPANSYKIIVSQDYGSPFQEYSIMYAFCMGGKHWPGHVQKLNQLYPDTYQYFTWDNSLKYWGEPFDPEKISDSGKPLYLYLEKNNEELYQRTIQKFFLDQSKIQVMRKLIFDNPVNGEVIYRLILSRTPNSDH
jgi:hypothetical protein